MSRSRRSAKTAGARAERAVADYLAAELADDRIDRRVKTGAKDRGDVTGVRVHGQRVVIEIKDVARTDLPGWTAQAHVEAGNDDALVGVVIAKRRGTTHPGRWWVHMTLDDLASPARRDTPRPSSGHCLSDITAGQTHKPFAIPANTTKPQANIRGASQSQNELTATSTPPAFCALTGFAIWGQSAQICRNLGTFIVCWMVRVFTC